MTTKTYYWPKEKPKKVRTGEPHCKPLVDRKSGDTSNIDLFWKGRLTRKLLPSNMRLDERSGALVVQLQRGARVCIGNMNHFR